MRFPDIIREILILFLTICYELEGMKNKAEYVSKWMDMSEEDLIKECRTFFDENYALSCFRLGEAYCHGIYEFRNDGEALKYGHSINEVCEYFGIRV